MFFSLRAIGLQISILSISATCLAGGETNGIPEELHYPSITWGAETNNIRMGINIRNKTGQPEIQIMVVSSSTNTGWDYIAPPNGKLRKVELRDASGSIIAAKRGDGDLAGELPQRILAKDLPFSKGQGQLVGKTGRYRDRLSFAENSPGNLKVFKIYDAFLIEKEGDYTITICAAIYKFDKDGKYADRIDLPCVTSRFSFNPEEQ